MNSSSSKSILSDPNSINAEALASIQRSCFTLWPAMSMTSNRNSETSPSKSNLPSSSEFKVIDPLASRIRCSDTTPFSSERVYEASLTVPFTLIPFNPSSRFTDIIPKPLSWKSCLKRSLSLQDSLIHALVISSPTSMDLPSFSKRSCIVPLPSSFAFRIDCWRCCHPLAFTSR